MITDGTEYFGGTVHPNPLFTLFTSVTVRFRVLYVFVALEIGSRRFVTAMSPSIPRRNGRSSSSGKPFPAMRITSFLFTLGIRPFSANLDGMLESWGIRVPRSPVRMPTANAHCERLIGTIRRECLDYVIPLNVFHLRRILGEWIRHYNCGSYYLTSLCV